MQHKYSTLCYIHVAHIGSYRNWSMKYCIANSSKTWKRRRTLCLPLCIWILKNVPLRYYLKLCQRFSLKKPSKFSISCKLVKGSESNHISIHRKYELIEPQLSTMARLCASCIVSAFQQFSIGASKKRAFNLTDASGDINARAVKMRKLDETNASVDIMQSNDEPNSLPIVKCPQSLQTALRYLFKLFTMIYLVDEITPNSYFVCKFFKILQQCGRNRIKPVLNLLPTGLIQSLLKSMSYDDFNYDFILR